MPKLLSSGSAVLLTVRNTDNLLAVAAFDDPITAVFAEPIYGFNFIRHRLSHEASKGVSGAFSAGAGSVFVSGARGALFTI